MSEGVMGKEVGLMKRLIARLTLVAAIATAALLFTAGGASAAPYPYCGPATGPCYGYAGYPGYAGYAGYTGYAAYPYTAYTGYNVGYTGYPPYIPVSYGGGYAPYNYYAGYAPYWWYR
jgi:hypothetical protein